MREDYSNKYFLAIESLAKRESLPLVQLTNWCESGEVEARQIGDHWFVNPQDWSVKKKDLAGATYLPLHSWLLLLAGLLIFINIVVSTPFTQRFRAGSDVIIKTTATILNSSFETEARGTVASVYDLLWIRLDRFWLITGEFFDTIASNLNYFWDKALNSWRKFVGSDTIDSTGPPSTTSNPALLTLDPTTLEALKDQIKAELLRDLGQQANPQDKPSATPGLVVLPSTGDPRSDAALKLDLQNTFSDRVEVEFDQSGQTGVITPIFKSGRGDNYIFILTPIRQN